ncbi:hypothetical protein Ssi03_17710 [Sphaerisporangium siamense]|uniref:Secreted protein n=1 Tax=Sphaerisporangium siamense TaxID=795645 RepID=A0A7W7DFW5_9ACTN|nr:hypothetical protein [Sphaerisporangium siamense]MBB4704976.1 hypothetical protein [Sphaerisporangium siamense]GII83781.1 hypothetical protein Ssi03_17710 [Sphaerisporangium siamense]
MNAPARFGAYVLGLAVVFGGALGAGRAVGPLGAPAEAEHAAAPGRTAAPIAADTPGGLQVSENGYTLTPVGAAIEPGETTDYRFTVTGPDGRPVTAYQVQHEKKLHFIVVSRDLATFRHLHPVEAGGGVWSVPLTLPAAGAYRAFADFAPEGGEALTLGADLFVPGAYTPGPLPAASRTATVDGYTVTLGGDLTAGRSSMLTLSVRKDGRPVTDLQPYLGAYGHLVALRAGDLAYLHVHPDGEPGDGTTKPGPDVAFHVEAPSAGSYRLFLDFRHGGEVRTAAFTVTAGQAAPATPGASESPGGHGGSGGSGGSGGHGH